MNRNWYQQAQRLELYAHHLSRCPSYALSNNVITGPFRRFDLYRLKTKFAAEVRRNLFEAYMRPRRTLINLISVNANSSAALPGGEAFRFAFSPNGQTILALSSSRIYVLDATTETLTVRRELKTLRRPIAASITDDGSLLAVLSSRHQVNIYALGTEGPQHIQVLALNEPPRTIALAHEGTVLGAAYNGLVEVFSLAANALSTDRRAVRSEAMDTLQFSGDGSMLVGSSQSLDEPNAVVINAPFYTENDPDITPREMHSRMWTTQILFPQISSICSHAELLQGHNEGDANWLFAYDHSLMSYRAVRTDDTRTGVAYFLNPPTSRRWSLPVPSTAPTATACGTLVAAGYANNGLWLYGIPERLDASPDMGSVVERHEERMRGGVHLTTATGHIEPLMAYSPSVSGSSDEMEGLDSLAQKVDWRQSLFVKCRAVSSLEGCFASKWVERSETREFGFNGKRLVAVAPGGVNALGEELGEESMPVDGSRICLLDFDYAPRSFEDREITIEVGDNPPELLTEHAGNMDVEVALERRRTVRGAVGRPVVSTSLTRSQTAASPPAEGYLNRSLPRGSASQPSSLAEGPRSSILKPPFSVHRTATSGGYRSALYPPRPPLGQEAPAANTGPGRRPSQDSWETPPPPYSNGGQTPDSAQHGWARLAHGAFSTSYGTPAVYTPGTVAQAINAPTAQSHTNHGSPALRPRAPLLATVTEATLQNSFTPPMMPATSPMNTGSSARTPHGRSTDQTQPFMSATIDHPVSPPTPHDNPFAGNSISPLDQLRPGSENSALTSSNLHANTQQPALSAPNLPAQYRSVSTPLSHQALLPQRSNNHHFAGSTPDQVMNLERRLPHRDQSMPHIDNIDAAQRIIGGVPSSPPRGAWGASGVLGAPTFNRAITTPNGLQRSGSRGSGSSIPLSNSTPNLIGPSRPNYGHMDTIDRVGSQVERQGPTRMRAHSATENIPAPLPEDMAFFAHGESRTDTDPYVGESKKARRSRKAKSESNWGGRSEIGTGKKKGTRCVVM